MEVWRDETRADHHSREGVAVRAPQDAAAALIPRRRLVPLDHSALHQLFGSGRAAPV